MLSAKEIEDYVQGPSRRRETKQFTVIEAKQIGDALGIRWDAFDVEQFTLGLNVERDHLGRGPAPDGTRDELLLTGKSVLAHLAEFPDYYTRRVATADRTKRTEVRLAGEGQ